MSKDLLSEKKEQDPFKTSLGTAPPRQEGPLTGDMEPAAGSREGEGVDGEIAGDPFASFFDDVLSRLGLNSPFGRITPPLEHRPIDDVLGSLPPRGGSATVHLVSESKLRTLLTSAVSLLDTEPTLSVNADVARSLINLAIDEITPK